MRSPPFTLSASARAALTTQHAGAPFSDLETPFVMTLDAVCAEKLLLTSRAGDRTLFDLELAIGTLAVGDQRRVGNIEIPVTLSGSIASASLLFVATAAGRTSSVTVPLIVDRL